MYTNKRSIILFIYVISLIFLFQLGSKFIGTKAATNTTKTITASPFMTIEATRQVEEPASSESQIVLSYLSERYAIPLEYLIVINEHQREYPTLKRNFRAFTILDKQRNNWIKLLVDEQDHRVIEDVNAIQLAEDEAFQAEYGKFNPKLLERLATMGDNETVQVMLWPSKTQGQDQAENEKVAIDSLAKKYTEVMDAVEHGRKPMDTSSSELSKQVNKEYSQLLQELSSQRILPLVQTTKSQGIAIKTFKGLPAVIATLSKESILRLSKQNEVGSIDLMDGGKIITMLDTATQTNRVPYVWARGIDGTGVKIAILEPDNVDFSFTNQNCVSNNSNCFRNPGATLLGIDREDNHATLVASAAASDHRVYKGMAPGATVISAGMPGYSRENAITALIWALDQGVKVINASIGLCPTTKDMDVLDKVVDHYARNMFLFMTVAAGNTTNCLDNDEWVDSPARAWNVLSVGSYNDKRTITWANRISPTQVPPPIQYPTSTPEAPGKDAMANFSQWRNPLSPRNDHEKPEIVAPGVDISGMGKAGEIPPNPEARNGTSFSAPQVAGLGALLIQRNNSLERWPEAMRAIIMASAVHNIEGPSIIVSGQDLKDGAGGINAALADQAARTGYLGVDNTTCMGLCWWGVQINDSTLSLGSYLHRYFRARKGERIRVAISWWSNVNCPSTDNCLYDNLDTDLSLGIMDSRGNWVPGAWSASWDNNYEMVEFTVPENDTYDIAVYRAGIQETVNYLGMALVRDETYLPELWNQDGWVSTIYLRNNGSITRSVSLYYFKSDGNSTPWNTDTCNLAPNQWCSIPVNENSRIPSGEVGSAIIAAGEEVSALVETEKNSGREQTNYTGIMQEGGSGSIGWELAGTTLYAPVVKRNYAGRSTNIVVNNLGDRSTYIYVEFIDGSGNSRSSQYYVNSRGRVSITPGGSGSGGCNTDNTVCSAIISSQDAVQLAAVAEEYNVSDLLSRTTHNLFSSGATTIYFPVVKYSYVNMSTGLRIQNVGSAYTTITVKFYNSQGIYMSGCDVVSPYISPYAGYTFTLGSCLGNGFVGTAIATADSNIVGMANEVSITGQGGIKKGYSSFQTGSRLVIAPLVYGNQTNWKSGISVMCLSPDTDSCKVNLSFFNSFGNDPTGTLTDQIIPFRGTKSFSPPNNLSGSAVIEADGAIAVVVNIVNNQTSGDTHAIYNANGR